MPLYRLNRRDRTTTQWNRMGFHRNDTNDSDSDDSSSNSDSNSVISSVSNHSSRSNSVASDGEGNRHSDDSFIIPADSSDDDDNDQNATANNNNNNSDSDASLGSIRSRHSNNSGSGSSNSNNLVIPDSDSDNDSPQSAQSSNSGWRSLRFSARQPDPDSSDEDPDFITNRVPETPPHRSESSENSEDEDSGQIISADSDEESFVQDLLNTFSPPDNLNVPGPPILNFSSTSDNDSSDSETRENQIPPGSFSPVGNSRNMTGPRIAPSSSASSTRASSISYECSVCLENLDAPASIDVPGGGANPGSNENDVQQVQVNGTVGSPRGSARGRGRGGARLSARSQRLVVSTPPPPPPNRVVSLTDVVATFCGHMYHQICLEKWFEEQGKRTCPSCRVSVPKAKQIRLYPNISVDTGVRNRNVSPENVNLPGPSSTNNVNASNSVPSAGTSASVRPTVIVNGGGGDVQCTKPECQDLNVIHNTLINDYNDLQERYNDIRENEELKEAQIRSLEEDNIRQCTEIQRLKRQIEDAAVPAPPPTTNKRRRY